MRKEISYVEFTAPVAVNATNDRFANQIVSSGEITYENGAYLVEFYAYEAEGIKLILEDESGRIGWLAYLKDKRPILATARLGLTAGPRSLRVTARRLTRKSGHVVSGWLRITRVDE